MSWTGFGNLDLTEVEAEKGRVTLLPGNYICKITNAEIKDTNDKKGKGLVVEFQDRDGAGKSDTFINLVNHNEEAQRIGRSTLKALLIAAGHPNPDRPGDIASLKGLTVGVRIEQGPDWTDRSGNVRPGGGKVRRNGAFFSPDTNERLGPIAVARPAGGSGGSFTSRGGSATMLDDEIPF